MAKAGAKFDEIVRARVPAALKREAEELLDAMGLKARKADLTRCPAQRRKAESKHIKI